MADTNMADINVAPGGAAHLGICARGRARRGEPSLPTRETGGTSFECSAACQFAATLDTPDCIYIRYLMGRAAAGWPDALAFPTRFLGALPVRYAPYLCISGLSHREGWRLGHRARWLQAAHAGWNVSVSERSQLTYPVETVCSPLGHSGNPGVNGESYRGEMRTVHAWAGSALAHKLVRKGAHHVCTMYACFLPDIDFHTPVLPVQPLPPTVFVYQVYLTGGGVLPRPIHTPLPVSYTSYLPQMCLTGGLCLAAPTADRGSWRDGARTRLPRSMLEPDSGREWQ